MAMMYPVFQPLGADAARVKGNKKTVKPAAKRKTPGTVSNPVSTETKSKAGQTFSLTVELHKTIQELSRERIGASLGSNDTNSLGFCKLEFQQDEERQGDAGDYDSESAESPSPAYV